MLTLDERKDLIAKLAGAVAKADAAKLPFKLEVVEDDDRVTLSMTYPDNLLLDRSTGKMVLVGDDVDHNSGGAVDAAGYAYLCEEPWAALTAIAPEVDDVCFDDSGIDSDSIRTVNQWIYWKTADVTAVSALTVNQIAISITEGMDEGVKTGAWDYELDIDTAELAVEFYGTDDGEIGDDVRALSDEDRAELLAAVQAHIDERRAEINAAS